MIDKKTLPLALAFILGALTLRATDLDTIGLTRLLASHPTLTGAGLTVGQPEAGNGTPAFEINPATVNEPESLFTWISTNESSTVFPNAIGTESGHADAVADNFFAHGTGVATGLSHVDNQDADYFAGMVIPTSQPIDDTIVNQSWIDGDITQVTIDDDDYDNYVATYGTIFCSSVGNGGNVYPPSTAYNVIGVGCYGIGASSSVGPTTDNGRSKPDLVAPSLETSFSAPYVSGAAAVLVQAVLRGDGGDNTNNASDLRAIKALLLNGAVKPFGWTHTTNAPLDTAYGAGLLNIYYSYAQLSAGQQAFSSSDSSAAPEFSNPIASIAGWDFQSIASGLLNATVNHYCFDVTNSLRFTFTATIDWERALHASSVNQITLSLFNFDTGAVVAQSLSSVDNVQHLYVPDLPSGRYDLQVNRAATVSPSDDYALAYQYFPITPVPLTISNAGPNVIISWPSTPTIYTLQQTSSLTPPISWTAVPNSQFLTNGLVIVNLTPASPAFYRLRQ